MTTASKGSGHPVTRTWLYVVLLLVLLPPKAWAREFAQYPGDWGVPPGTGSISAYHFGGALRVQTTMTPEGYYARILVRGISPEDIRVYPRRGYLIIEADEGERTGTAGAQARSQSQWQMHLRRQLRIPYDADVSGMTMKTGNGMVDIFLPFR